MGRVAENCTQVKSTSTYINYYSSKSKINNPNSYLSKSKKVSNEKSIQVTSYFVCVCVYTVYLNNFKGDFVNI